MLTFIKMSNLKISQTEQRQFIDPNLIGLQIVNLYLKRTTTMIYNNFPHGIYITNNPGLHIFFIL